MSALLGALALAVLLAACEGAESPPDGAQGDRVTISIAVLDDANRRAALYAIEQGILTSDTVDVDVTYLPLSTIIDVAPAKQYDVIEASPLAVPFGAARDLDYVILSAGLQNRDGTILFVKADSDLSGPADLRGLRVGVRRLDGTFTLEARYLLQETYGLDVSLEGGDVTIAEQPLESLPALLLSDDLDAAVLLRVQAFRLLEDDEFRVLSRVTDEVQELLAGPVMNSILVTYPDVARQKTEALRELNRLLAASVVYFRANQDDVIEAVATEQESPEYLEWWWERQELLLGDLSTDMQEQLLAIWGAARAVGDIEESPALADVLFNPEATPPASDGSSP